jgi:hypothetical protein
MKNRQLCAFDMRVDDLDDQGWAFLYLLPDAQVRRATAQQGGLQRQCVKSAQQLIQVIQVILTPLRKRFLATIKVVTNFQRWPSRSSRRGLAHPSAGLPEVVPSGAGAARGRPFDGAELCMGPWRSE